MNQNQHVKTLWPCFSLSIWSRGMFFMFHDYDLVQEGILHQGYVVQPNLCWQLHPFVSCLESFIVLHGALITKHAWAPRTAQVQMYFVTINLWVHFTCIYYYSLLVSSYHRNQVSTASIDNEIDKDCLLIPAIFWLSTLNTFEPR